MLVHYPLFQTELFYRAVLKDAGENEQIRLSDMTRVQRIKRTSRTDHGLVAGMPAPRSSHVDVALTGRAYRPSQPNDGPATCVWLSRIYPRSRSPTNFKLAKLMWLSARDEKVLSLGNRSAPSVRSGRLSGYCPT